MKLYIGTKQIKATPMNRLAYNELRGWQLPSDENGDDDGYLVEYLDGGKSNVEGYAGYISWSPKQQFDNAYKEDGDFTFGDAVLLMKQGKKMARSGWNGKGLYVCLFLGSNGSISPAQGFGFGPGFGENSREISFADTLADDWCIVE